VKPIRSAKQVTFLYFSIVAFAIIVIHASVFTITTEQMEYIYAHNRLGKIKSYAKQELASNDIDDQASIELQTQGKTDFDRNIKIYFDLDNLPEGFPKATQIPYDESIEIEFEPTLQAYFVMKVNMAINGELKDVLLVIDNSLYENSEEQLLPNQVKPIVISFLLLLTSLLVVLKISERLTQPISSFAKTLAEKSPDDLTPLPFPDGTYTKELLKMIDTFNHYQSRINALLERERSFNRYISHELRSPLMVMSGAITLLGESNDPKFIDKQRQRLRKSSKQMEEFIETLLSLSKVQEGIDLLPRQISESELKNIAIAHEHLLKNKAVDWRIIVNSSPAVNIPEAAFHILLGNLIKNAFLYTQQGHVTIVTTQQTIQVIDSGMGLNESNSKPEGFALGLLLVKDICHRYGWSFELKNNDVSGCTATISCMT